MGEAWRTKKENVWPVGGGHEGHFDAGLMPLDRSSVCARLHLLQLHPPPMFVSSRPGKRNQVAVAIALQHMTYPQCFKPFSLTPKATFAQTFVQTRRPHFRTQFPCRAWQRQHGARHAKIRAWLSSWKRISYDWFVLLHYSGWYFNIYILDHAASISSPR
jgi:hypothetical protein